MIRHQGRYQVFQNYMRIIHASKKSSVKFHPPQDKKMCTEDRGRRGGGKKKKRNSCSVDGKRRGSLVKKIQDRFFGWRSGQHYSTVGFDLRFRSEGEIQAPLLVSSVPTCRRAQRELRAASKSEWNARTTTTVRTLTTRFIIFPF